VSVELAVERITESLARIQRDYPAAKAVGWSKPVRGQNRGGSGGHSDPTATTVIDGREIRNHNSKVTGYKPGWASECRDVVREADRQLRIAETAVYAVSRALERALEHEPEHEWREPPPMPDDPDDPAGGWRVSRAELEQATVKQAARGVDYGEGS